MKNTNVKLNINEKKYELNLFKRETWYNPLYINIANNSYQLDKIYFYNKDGIVYQNSKGWFGISSFNVFLRTSKEIKRKNKIDYSNKIPFITRAECNWDKRYDLYLPIEDFKLNVSYNKVDFMIIQKVTFYDEHNQLCYFENCVKCLDNQLFDIYDRYEVHLKNIKDLKNITEMYFLDELEILKGLAEEYYKELQYITKYTVEDYLKEIKRN